MPRRRRRPAPRPWTAEEDARLREIMAIGLCNEFWSTALPDRSFGEIVERRLDLAVPIAPLL